jgi:hypothetical protein
MWAPGRRTEGPGPWFKVPDKRLTSKDLFRTLTGLKDWGRRGLGGWGPPRSEHVRALI